MKIKEAIYDRGCPKCGAGKKLITKDVYGCDLCKKEISSPHDDNTNYLEITVFYRGEREAAHLQFCSWHCVFEFISKIQKTKYRSNYFVALPYIKFDDDKPGYIEFIKELRRRKKHENNIRRSR